jgi:hypothetical protein
MNTLFPAFLDLDLSQNSITVLGNNDRCTSIMFWFSE